MPAGHVCCPYTQSNSAGDRTGTGLMPIEVHIGATWRIRLNRPCAAATRPYVELLWGLINFTTAGRYSPNAVSSSELCSTSTSYYYDDRDYSATPSTTTTGNHEDIDDTEPELDR